MMHLRRESLTYVMYCSRVTVVYMNIVYVEQYKKTGGCLNTGRVGFPGYGLGCNHFWWWCSNCPHEIGVHNVIGQKLGLFTIFELEQFSS